MCAFVSVLEVGLFRRSTKEMWRFGLNSPCVCTNETVILIVDYLSSRVLLLYPVLKSLYAILLMLVVTCVGISSVSTILSSIPRLILQEEKLLGAVESDICEDQALE